MEENHIGVLGSGGTGKANEIAVIGYSEYKDRLLPLLDHLRAVKENTRIVSVEESESLIKGSDIHAKMLITEQNRPSLLSDFSKRGNRHTPKKKKRIKRKRTHRK